MGEQKKPQVYKNTDGLHLVTENNLFLNESDGATEDKIINNKYFVVRSTTADPASLITGQLWFRSDV